MITDRIHEVYASPAYKKLAEDPLFSDRIPQAWFADVYEAFGAAIRRIDELESALRTNTTNT